MNFKKDRGLGSRRLACIPAEQAMFAFILIVSSASLAFCPPALAKKNKNKDLPVKEALPPIKVDSPECIDLCKKASVLFASGKSIDAMKLLTANQAKFSDSLRFNLLVSTVLLRVSGQEKAAADAAATAVKLDPFSVPANLQYGVCLMASGQPEKAAGAFEKLVSIDPANYEAWSALGQLYNELHNQARSKQCAAKAAVLEPNSRSAKVRTAQNLFKQGNTNAVSQELSRLVTDDHLEPEFFIGLSKDALNMQAYAESIQAADKALSVYPELSDLLKTKAQAQLWKREYEAGLATIEKARIASDADGSALHAVLLIKLGRTRDAESILARLPKNNTEFPLVGLAHGYLAERNGEVDEAIKQFEFSLRNNQLFAPAHIELARIYLRQGLTDEVLSEAREIQRSKPNISTGKAMESRLALEGAPARDRVAEAIRLAREALKIDSDDPEALTALALSELKGGHTQTAGELTKKALEIEPGNIDAALASAKVLEGDGKKQESLDALLELNQRAKGDSEVLSALAQSYGDSGDQSSAIKLLKEKLEEGNTDPVVAFTLARSYQRTGRSGEASKYFQKSLSGGLKGKRADIARDALKNLGAKSNEEI